MATIAELEQRITELEQRDLVLKDLPLRPLMSRIEQDLLPNSLAELTKDAGLITAGTFRGTTFETSAPGDDPRVAMDETGWHKTDTAGDEVVALGPTDGLDLTASVSSTPPSDRQIRWMRGNDGTLAAALKTWDDGTGTNFELNAVDEAADTAVHRVTLKSDAGGAAGGAPWRAAGLRVEATRSGVSRVIVSTNQAALAQNVAVILDQNGDSDFIFRDEGPFIPESDGPFIPESDAGDFALEAAPKARVHASAAQTLATGTATKITFNTAHWDANGASAHFDDTNDRLYARAAGLYWVHGAVSFVPNGVGYRRAYFYKNGVAGEVYGMTTQAATPTEYADVQVGSLIDLAEGDYVELWGQQTSIGNLNTYEARGRTFLAFQRLGA